MVTVTIEREIRNEKNAKQKLCFGESDKENKPLLVWKGIEYLKYSLTDVDKVIKIKDVYYFIEAKHNGAQMETGQKLAFERLVNDIVSVGRKAMYILVNHTQNNNKAITMDDCQIEKIYRYGEGWKEEKDYQTLNEFIENEKNKLGNEIIYFTKIDALLEMKNKSYLFIETSNDSEKKKFLIELSELLQKAGKDSLILFVTGEVKDEKTNLLDCSINALNKNGIWYKTNKTNIQDNFTWFYQKYAS